MVRKIPLFHIYWDEDDLKSVSKTIKRGGQWAQGPEIQKFEQLIADYLKVDYCLVFNSGTSALHACLMGLDIKKGSEVIVPSFTFIATANSPLFIEAEPKFADIEESTYGLDPLDVVKRINDKTKVIIPIHYGGSVCRINELYDIAEDENIILIEDNAESLGAKCGNKMVGTFGKASILSFCQNKIITTGEGGAVATNDKELFEKLKLIRSHGRLESGDYFTSSGFMDYVSLGFNFRMPSVLANLGISQILKIDKIIKMRQDNAKYLNGRLSKISEIQTPNQLRNSSHVYQMYTIRVKDGEVKRNALKTFLEKNGISTKVYFDPIHLTNFYRKTFKFEEGELPITEKISKEVLTLPMYPQLSREDMDYIVQKLNEFFTKEANKYE